MTVRHGSTAGQAARPATGAAIPAGMALALGATATRRLRRALD